MALTISKTPVIRCAVGSPTLHKRINSKLESSPSSEVPQSSLYHGATAKEFFKYIVTVHTKPDGYTRPAFVASLGAVFAYTIQDARNQAKFLYSCKPSEYLEILQASTE